MPRRLTKDEKANRDAHFEQHKNCWMCMFLGRKQGYRTELHHIAGKKAKGHECRENYCAICTHHHEKLQSRTQAELVCLSLKKLYDFGWYSPEAVSVLRGKSPKCWTDLDVVRTTNTMQTMTEVLK